MRVPCRMKTVNRHHAHERLHEENVVFEALGVSRNSAVWHRWGYENICAMAPIQLSEAHCTLCKGALQIVGSALQLFQQTPPHRNGAGANLLYVSRQNLLPS